MELYKFQASGNDFIITTEETNLNERAVALCSRHLSLGGDGLIFVNPNNYEVRFFNPDGSEATLCGNGLRCVGLFLNRYLHKSIFVVKVSGHEFKLRVYQDNTVKVFFNKSLIHLPFETIDLVELNKKGYLVDVGNKHFVYRIDNFYEVNESVIKIIKDVIKEDVNIDFVKIVDALRIEVITFEKGVGFTLSCGSGSLASAITFNQLGLINDLIEIKNPNGNITINSKEMSLMGKVNFVYKVTIDE